MFFKKNEPANREDARLTAQYPILIFTLSYTAFRILTNTSQFSITKLSSTAFHSFCK